MPTINEALNGREDCIGVFVDIVERLSLESFLSAEVQIAIFLITFFSTKFPWAPKSCQVPFSICHKLAVWNFLMVKTTWPWQISSPFKQLFTSKWNTVDPRDMLSNTIMCNTNGSCVPIYFSIPSKRYAHLKLHNLKSPKSTTDVQAFCLNSNTTMTSVIPIMMDIFIGSPVLQLRLFVTEQFTWAESTLVLQPRGSSLPLSVLGGTILGSTVWISCWTVTLFPSRLRLLLCRNN